MDSQNNPQSINNGGTVALVCYFTLVGWIIAFIIHSGNKTRLGAFHLRQMLGLMVLAVAVYILGFPLAMVPFLGWIIGLALNISILVFWIIGLIAAINGQERSVPVVGSVFQQWFAGLGL